jgi:hypothetical protein
VAPIPGESHPFVPALSHAQSSVNTMGPFGRTQEVSEMSDEVEVMEADDGLGGTVPQSNETPWADVDDELKKYADNKGFKDVGDILKSQRDAEAELRRMQSEFDQIRREAEALTMDDDDDDALAPSEPSGFPEYSELLEIFRGDERAVIDYMIQQRMNEAFSQFVPYIEQQIESKVEPVAQFATEKQLDEVASEIAATYPDFEDLAPEVIEVINRDPERFNSPQGMWSAYGLVRAKHDRDQAIQRQREAGAETLDHSSRARQQNAADAIVRAIEGSGRQFSDGL